METNRKIIAIVFQDGRPWSAVTADGCIFDVELCKADDTLYFHECGTYGIDGDSVYLEGGMFAGIPTNIVSRYTVLADFAVNGVRLAPPRFQPPKPFRVDVLQPVPHALAGVDLRRESLCQPEVILSLHWDTAAGWWTGEVVPRSKGAAK